MIVHKVVGMPGVNRVRNILLGAACINRSDRWIFGTYLDPLQQRKYQTDYIMQHIVPVLVQNINIIVMIYLYNVLPYSRVSVSSTKGKPSPYIQSTHKCNISCHDAQW